MMLDIRNGSFRFFLVPRSS